MLSDDMGVSRSIGAHREPQPSPLPVARRFQSGQQSTRAIVPLPVRVPPEIGGNTSICKDLSKGRAPTPTPMETCNDPPPRLFPGQDTLSQRKSRTGDDLLSRSWRSSPSHPPAAARLPDLVAYVPQSRSLACRPLSCGG